MFGTKVKAETSNKLIKAQFYSNPSRLIKYLEVVDVPVEGRCGVGRGGRAVHPHDVVHQVSLLHPFYPGVALRVG